MIISIAELQKQLVINEDLSKTNRDCEEIISKLKQEIEDVKTAAAVAETARKSDLEDLTRQHKEEVASIQILVNDTLEQFQRSEEDSQASDLKKRVQDLETENSSLKSKMDNRYKIIKYLSFYLILNIFNQGWFIISGS